MTHLTLCIEIKWHIKGYDDYVICEDKKLYNAKRARPVKQVYNNGCIGYNLKGKFVSLSRLRPLLYVQRKSECPFLTPEHKLST